MYGYIYAVSAFALLPSILVFHARLVMFYVGYYFHAHKYRYYRIHQPAGLVCAAVCRYRLLTVQASDILSMRWYDR